MTGRMGKPEGDCVPVRTCDDETDGVRAPEGDLLGVGACEGVPVVDCEGVAVRLGVPEELNVALGVTDGVGGVLGVPERVPLLVPDDVPLRVLEPLGEAACDGLPLAVAVALGVPEPVPVGVGATDPEAD